MINQLLQDDKTLYRVCDFLDINTIEKFARAYPSYRLQTIIQARRMVVWIRSNQSKQNRIVASTSSVMVPALIGAWKKKGS